MIPRHICQRCAVRGQCWGSIEILSFDQCFDGQKFAIFVSTLDGDGANEILDVGGTVVGMVFHHRNQSLSGCVQHVIRKPQVGRCISEWGGWHVEIEIEALGVDSLVFHVGKEQCIGVGEVFATPVFMHQGSNVKVRASHVGGGSGCVLCVVGGTDQDTSSCLHGSTFVPYHLALGRDANLTQS